MVVLAGGARLVFASWLAAGIVALAVALIGLLAVLLWLLLSQEREDRLARGLEGPQVRAQRQAAEAQRAALGSLESSFRRALDDLRESRLGRDGVYALPWVLVMGDPRSGKTALLRESGLELPAELPPPPAAAATQNCDFWFTNDAILIDLAGRYGRSDAAADRREWSQLLQLLRRSRPRCPLNGLLLVLSAPDLLARDATALEEDARSLRRRLNELTDKLGVELPIYVTVSQMDRVEGFLELASALAPGRLQEALGWTQGERHFADAGDVTLKGLDALRSRLETLIPEMVMRESDPSRRLKILLFPDRLSAVSQSLAAFLRRAFAPSVYEETPFLRGVYFTSVGRGVGPARGLFVRDLFREVIIGDRDLALPTRGLGPRERRLTLAAGALAALVACAALALPFTLQFRAARQLARDAGSVIAAPSSLEALDRLRTSIEQGASATSGPPPAALDRARATFVWAFGREYEDPTKVHLLEALQRGDDEAFAALADLAIDVSWLGSRAAPGGGMRPQLARFAPIGHAKGDAETFAAAYDAFVRWLPDGDLEPRVDRERSALMRGSGELLDLGRLERWGEQKGGGGVHYTDAGLVQPAAGMRDQVPAAYTRPTWESFVRGLIDAVTRTGGAERGAIDAFRRGYVSRFDAAWRAYLLDAPTPPGAEPRPKDSPYLKLLEQIDQQTRADLPREGALPTWIQILREVRRESAPEGKGGIPLPGWVQALRDGKKEDAAGQKEKAPPWTRYLDSLDQVAADVASTEVRSEDALDLASHVAKHEPNSFQGALDLLREIVPSEGDPAAAAKLRSLLAMPVLDAFSVVLDRAMGELDRRWSERIAAPYSGALSQNRLESLYAPQTGDLARFRSEVLDLYFADGQPKPLLEDRAMPFGEAFRAWLRGADGLQRTLFPGLGGAPREAVRLEGIPSRVSGSGNLFVLRQDLSLGCGTGDQTFVYREGTGTFTFPWSAECQQVSLRVWVRDASGVERELQPRREWHGPLAFPSFLREGQNLGAGRLQWSLHYPDDGVDVTIQYQLRSGESLLSISQGEPPASMRN